MKLAGLPPSRRKRQPVPVSAGNQPLAVQLFGRRPEHTLALLRAAWPAAVGPELARRTEVVALDGRMLRVRVPDVRWQKVLHRMQRQILERLWRAAGDLAPKALGFHLGAVSAAQPPEPPTPAPAPAPPVPDSIRQAAQTIADPELREQFEKAAARYLQIQKVP